FPFAWLAVTQGEQFRLLVWLVSGAYLVVGIGQSLYCLHHARKLPLESQPRQGEGRRWWRFALPWVIIVLATDFFFDLDMIFLAGGMSKEEVAIFGVCARIFMLVSFAVTAVYAVTLPDIFESNVKHGATELHKKIGDTNVVASILALVLLVGVVVGGPLLLL